MDFVGNGLDRGFEEVRGGPAIGSFVQFGIGELRGAVDRHEQVKLAFFGANLGDVEMEVADRIGLKLLPLGLFAFCLRQAADAVALKAAVQR